MEEFMPDIQKLNRTRINAEIISIRYENPGNGFAVVSLLCSDGLKIAAKGTINSPVCGQNIEAEGYFETKTPMRKNTGMSAISQ